MSRECAQPSHPIHEAGHAVMLHRFRIKLWDVTRKSIDRPTHATYLTLPHGGEPPQGVCGVSLLIEEHLGNRDAAFAGNRVKQIDASVFHENRRIAQLIHLPISGATH